MHEVLVRIDALPRSDPSTKSLHISSTLVGLVIFRFESSFSFTKFGTNYFVLCTLRINKGVIKNSSVFTLLKLLQV
jgi:hypothetical protein